MRKLKYSRDLVIGEQVKVYRNLNNGLLSVQDKNGTVVSHTRAVSLSNVKYIVRPAGRAKVLLERRKNIHAFICGELVSCDVVPYHGGRRVKYNPYKSDHFYFDSDKRRVDFSSTCVVLSSGTILHNAVLGKING